MILNEQKIKILEEYTREYTLRLTGSSIAQRKKLNQKSVSNVLKELEEEGILKSKTEGKNKLYFFNLDNKLILSNFISIIEHSKANLFYKKNPLIKEIAIKIIGKCEGIILIFGSYAKKINKTDSDLDIFIVGNYDEDYINSLSELYKVKISVKNYSLLEFKRSLSEPFILEIKKDHILLKGTEEFVEATMNENT
jgi:predicted nucleotidyltransferase